MLSIGVDSFDTLSQFNIPVFGQEVLWYGSAVHPSLCPSVNYRKVSNIRRTKSQNVNASHLIL